MGMENTERLRESINQMVSGLPGEEKFRETLNELINQLISTITPNQSQEDLETSDILMAAVSEAQRGDSGIKAAKDDDEYATVYFRLLSDGHGQWFAIPPPEVKVNELSPLFKEPNHRGISWVRSFTLGSYLVLIVDEFKMMQPNSSQLEKYVYYLDVSQPVAKRVWVQTDTFIGYPMCYFFLANYKIYGFSCIEDENFSLKILNFRELDKGWQSRSLPDFDYNTEYFFRRSFFAFKLEYEDSNSSDARRALIFTHNLRFSYDLTEDAFSVSEEDFGVVWGDYRYSDSEGVCVGDTMYMLAEVWKEHCTCCLVAYNLPKREWCLTPVTGLEEYGNVFPIPPRYDEVHHPARLLHLGKARLCILWSHTTGQTPQVYCTKFDVHENQDQHCAENVSTEVYKVTTGSGSQQFDAVAISSKLEDSKRNHMG